MSKHTYTDRYEARRTLTTMPGSGTNLSITHRIGTVHDTVVLTEDSVKDLCRDLADHLGWLVIPPTSVSARVGERLGLKEGQPLGPALDALLKIADAVVAVVEQLDDVSPSRLHALDSALEEWRACLLDPTPAIPTEPGLYLATLSGDGIPDKRVVVQIIGDRERPSYALSIRTGLRWFIQDPDLFTVAYDRNDDGSFVKVGA